MYSKKLSRLRCLSRDMVQRLQKSGGIHEPPVETVEQLLMMDEYSLIRRFDMDYRDVRKLLLDVSMEVAPQPATLSTLYLGGDDKKNLETGLPVLDRYLRGGLRQGTITEIVGPSGVGKTQFSMSMAVEAAMSRDDENSEKDNGGSYGSVVYLDTEKVMKTQDALGRLAEIGQNRKGVRAEQFMDRVRIFYMEDTDSMMGFIETQLPELIVEHNVRLVVLDSIAALPRKEFESIVHRQDTLGKLASKLKFIAEEFKIPMLLSNHVTIRTRSLNNQSKTGNLGEMGASRTATSELTAALGITWWHTVNTRLVFEEIDLVPQYDGIGSDDTSMKSFRQITISKSPLTGVHSVPYKIDARGVQVHEKAEQLSQLLWNQRQGQRERLISGGTRIAPRISNFANANANDLQHDVIQRQHNMPHQRR